MGPPRPLIVAMATWLAVGCVLANPYSWMERDNFDEVLDKMVTVNEQTCEQLSSDSLKLPANSLGQLPSFNRIPMIVVFPNRTKLIFAHNMALNRAYFYSYILQRLNSSELDFPRLPGFLYHYLSASADISASPGLMNGSSILYDTHMHFANYFTNLDFNKTLPLFGVKAWRLDDYQDNVNWLREPTNNTIKAVDLGAGADKNYTAPWHRLNPLFIRDTSQGIDFMPDSDGNSIKRKHQYDFSIYYADKTGVLHNYPHTAARFFGPPSPGLGETYRPVYFSRPYFDCGRSNLWQVSAVAPVIDYMHRYSNWTHLRRPLYVGIATTDVDFLRIDFDPCARSDGDDKTHFSGVARCRPTTLCEPLSGFGFKRGGYMCHCRPGYRYPYWQNGPFMGVQLEQASASEAEKFDCIPVGWKMQRLTSVGTSLGPGSARRRRRRSLQDTHELHYLMHRYRANSTSELNALVAKHNQEDRQAALDEKLSRQGVRRLWRGVKATVSAAVTAVMGANVTREPPRRIRRAISTRADFGDQNVHYLGRLGTFDSEKFRGVQSLMDWKRSVTSSNCAGLAPEKRELPGEAGFGADTQFEVQARTALKLSHFLSAFLQNVNPDELYGSLRSDARLNRDQIFGEVFANVMADSWILSSGVYFVRDGFYDLENNVTLEYFGPTAMKLNSDQQTQTGQRQSSFTAEDAAGWPSSRAYFNKDWFTVLKQRWASNSYGLETYVNKPYIRNDINGTASMPFQRFPLYYRAATYADLYWSKPYFDCNLDGMAGSRHLENWVITVSAPFFGQSKHKTLRFMGVVTVTVPLDKLDVKMCPDTFYQANFFKNSAPCHFDSTFCVPIVRNRFDQYMDSFKCECRQGFEYPYNDISVWYYAGGTVVQHYNKMVNDEKNYYRLLQCREASGTRLTCSWMATSLALMAALASAAWRDLRLLG